MSATSVALALVQPVGPPEVWSGSTLGEHLLKVLFQRHDDVYFRPLLQAPTLAALQWRIWGLGLRFTAERRAVNLISLMTRRKMPSDRDLDEVYAHVQRKLEQSWFSEETRERIDYVIFTMFRLASVFQRAAQPSTSNASHGRPGRWFDLVQQIARRSSSDLALHATPADVLDLFRITGKVELYVGAVLLALGEPTLVRNPLVLNELAVRASAAVDEYLAAAAKLGIEIA